MKTIRNLYHILGVSKNATKDEIRAAYRRLVKEKHPDTGNGTHEEFVEINMAYEILMDDEKRKLYDETGYTNINAIDCKEVAMEILQLKLRQAIANERLVDQNIIQIMRNMLLSDIKIYHVKRTNLQKRLKTLRKVQKRLKKKNQNGFTDILGMAVRDDIESVKKSLSDTNIQIQIAETALVLLNDYEYDLTKDIEDQLLENAR